MISRLFLYQNPPVSSVTFGLSATAVLALELFGLFLNTRQLLPPIILLSIIRLLQILLIITVVGMYQKNFQTIGLSRTTTRDGIRLGLIWSLCFGAVVMMPASVMLMAGVNPLQLFGLPKAVEPWKWIYLLFLHGFLGPVAEELFFRGILYGFFRRWGFLAALMLSNLAFIPLHANISLFQLIGGLLFAISYEFRGNLMIPICIHILGNSAIYLLSWIHFLSH